MCSVVSLQPVLLFVLKQGVKLHKYPFVTNVFHHAQSLQHLGSGQHNTYFLPPCSHSM